MNAAKILEQLSGSIDQDMTTAVLERDRHSSWTKAWAAANGRLKALARVKIRVQDWQELVDEQVERSKVQDLISL